MCGGKESVLAQLSRGGARLERMYSVFARYRGRSTRRADHVQASAQALSGLEGVGTVEVAGIEEFRAAPENAVGVTTLVLALLAAGDWAIGIGVCPQDDMEQRIWHRAQSLVREAGPAR